MGVVNNELNDMVRNYTLSSDRANAERDIRSILNDLQLATSNLVQATNSYRTGNRSLTGVDELESIRRKVEEVQRKFFDVMDKYEDKIDKDLKKTFNDLFDSITDSAERAMRESEESFNDFFNVIDKNLNDIIFDSGKKFDRMTTSFDQAVKSMSNIYEKSVKDSGNYRAGIDARLYKNQANLANKMLRDYENTYNQMKNFLNEEEKKQREEDISRMRQQAEAYNIQYEQGVKENLNGIGRLIAGVDDGIEGVNLKAISLTDIVSAINIDSIRRALTTGAESTIDVVSANSRIRGQSYQSLNSIRRGLSAGDTYNGAISAADIMSNYSMNSVSAGYLEEIDSYLALFEKETNTSAEQLETLVHWAEATGMNSRSLKTVMDDLQAMREQGGDVSELVDLLSENRYVVGDEQAQEEYIHAITAFEKLGLPEFQSMFTKSVKEGTVVNNQELMSLLGQAGLYDVSEYALTNQNYEEFAGYIVQAANILAGRTEGVNSAQVRGQLSTFGVDYATLKAVEEIANGSGWLATMNSINSASSTVESNADTIGYVSNWDRRMNQAGAGVFGDIWEKAELYTRDHPIVASLAGATIANLSTSLMKTVGKEVVSGIGAKLGVGVAGGGSSLLAAIGPALVSPIGLGIATAAAVGGIALGIDKAQENKEQNDMDWMTLDKAMEKAETAEEKRAAAEAINSKLQSTSWWNDSIDSSKRSQYQKYVQDYYTTYEGAGTAAYTQSAVSDLSSIVKDNFYNGDGKRHFGYEYDNRVNSGYKKWREENKNILTEDQMLDIYNSFLGTNYKSLPDTMAQDLNAVKDKFSSEASDQLIGRYATGLPYVPRDNYLASLHEGERVLTKSQNREYTSTAISTQNDVVLNTEKMVDKETMEVVEKILRDGFEFIGKKIDEAAKSKKPVYTETQQKGYSLTSLALSGSFK